MEIIMKGKPRVRNYITRNRKGSGWGKHRDKRREAQNGHSRHKKLFIVE
jgi:hypothetical protein